MRPQEVFHLSLDHDYAVEIPPELCQRFQLRPGVPLVLEATGNAITLRRLDAAGERDAED